MKFLEIKGDDQLSGNQQWMTKSISEEKQTRQSYSKVNVLHEFCVVLVKNGQIECLLLEKYIKILEILMHLYLTLVLFDVSAEKRRTAYRATEAKASDNVSHSPGEQLLKAFK